MPEQSRSGDAAALAFVLRAPERDLRRSPAALRVGALAAEAELFMFDYEQRVQLELPFPWLPVGRPDLGVTGVAPTWERGVLGESKYLAFRHDTLIASLHAGQRGKWTAHELCHGLVGCCWRPDGSMLFHALAARVAEVLPVALWYFFDEAGVVRCARHAAHSELGPSFCAACESLARAAEREDEAWIERGLAFVARELASVRAAIASGQPTFSAHGAIDLMTDGLAYASAHAPRLRAPETASAFLHTFVGAAGRERGLFDALEPFMAHVEALALYVAGRAPAPPVVRGGRWRFVAQDVGARLAQIAADTEGECLSALQSMIVRLGADASEAGVAAAIAGYAALFDDYELPAVEEVFAVGYDLPGTAHGRSARMVGEGLASALGTTLAELGRGCDVGALVATFVARGEPSRAPLPTRFAAFLRERAWADQVAFETAGLATLEAAIAAAAPPDPIELGLALDGALAETLRLPEGVALVRPGYDAGGLLMRGAADPTGPRSFLVRRDAGDEVGLIALSERLADRLAAGPLDAAVAVEEAAHDPELRALLEEGLLIPDRWELAVEVEPY